MVNADSYRIMITNFFVTALHGIAVNDVWFQKNDATCRTSQSTIDLLRQTTESRLIRRNDDVNWLSRTYEWTPFSMDCENWAFKGRQIEVAVV